MSRLVRLGQELAHSLEPGAIRTVAVAQLPLLCPGRRTWFMLRAESAREPIGTGDPAAGGAARAVACTSDEMSDAAAPGDVCFPMLAAEEELGMVGVASEPPLTPHQRNMLAAAAAFLAVSLKNAALLESIRQNSVRDALTGCFNRAHVLEVIDSELRRVRRSRAPLSLLMFDLDWFKSINDTQGHLCGDAVLASVGERMRAVLRGGDVKCRYGGEEFLVLLTDTPVAGACHVAEMLRRDFESHGVHWHGERVAVTASFGVATASPDETDPLALIARADRGLYLAKQQGRNRVCVAPLPLHDSPAADQPHQEQHDRDDQQDPDEVAECVAADHP
jgi:diguanylate cyclase (GGDEF)-like protein